MSDGQLRRGDLVEVRSAEEILATLDDDGAVDGLPFMPEMVPLCGQRFTVDRRAERVCDTFNHAQWSVQLSNVVLLEQLRCDGSAHGGCQALCRFFWRESWLRRVSAGDPIQPDQDESAVRALRERVTRTATRPNGESEVRYRCQATELPAFSTRISAKDPRQYFREYTSGNVTFRKFVRVMSRAAVLQPLHHLGKLTDPPLRGTTAKTPETPALDLQPGEWVRVKSPDEIAKTLTDKGKNRGLHFDREMLPFCGRTFRVGKRVTRVIDEQTGKMLELGNDCIVLEDVYCSGEHSVGRWFCPRESPPFWRECWLERVDPLDGSGPVAVGYPRSATDGQGHHD